MIDDIKTKPSFLKPKSWPIGLRILGVVLILGVPIAIIMMIFTPFISKQNVDVPSSSYKLANKFTKKDLKSLVIQMEKDVYFFSYFKWLPKDKVDRAVDEVYDVLSKNRDKEKHYALLDEMKTEVESLAVLINHIKFFDDIDQVGHESPDIVKTLWIFFYKEFKLTIVGLSYRVLYEPEFHFTWGDSSRLAAGKINNILSFIHADPPDF